MFNLYAILLIAGIAACLDLAYARIPNLFLLISLAAGAAARILAVCAASDVLPVAMPAQPAFFGAVPRPPAGWIGGVILPVLLLFPVWHFRMIGAGDIKLFSVLGFFAGAGDILWLMFWSFAIGAVFSIGILSANGNASERFSCLILFVRERLSGNGKGRLKPYREKLPEEEGGKVRRSSEMHFAVAVFMAAIMYTGRFFV